MATLKDINYGIGKYLVASDASTFPDILTNRKNVDLMNFKVAVNNAYSLYSFKDGMIDGYQTEDGIDTATTTNSDYDDTNKIFKPNFGNYFGNGELGDCQFSSGGITQTNDTVAIDTVLSTGTEAGGPGTSSMNTTQVLYSSACYELTVPNTSGGNDGDMVVAQFKDLIIDGNINLTVKQNNRGLFVYVDGDCTINGVLSMTCRGGNSNPNNSGGSDSSAVSATGLRIPMIVSGGTDTLAAADFAGAGNPVISAVANHGGIAGNGWIYGFEKLGTTGAPDKGANNGVSARMSGTAAGGTGGVTASNGGGAYSGYGGDGGAFSAGSASGSARKNGPGHQYSGNGQDWGGNGTAASGAPGGWASGGGGAGNPGGGSQGSGYNVNNPGAQNGVGGIIMLIVNGDLSIGGSGKITSKGAKGGRGYIGGGSSGSGAAIVLYAGSITNAGNIDLAFEPGGLNYTGNPSGNNPGNGGKWNEQVSGKNATGGMQMYSNTQGAAAVPTDCRLMLFEQDIDAITLNTDLKGYVSRDGGTNYTQVTLAEDTIYTVGGIDSYTKLMLHCDGSNGGTTFTDSSFTAHTVTPSGNANTSTAQFKFGTASAYFDGTGDWINTPATTDWDFASDDFTIDFWMRPGDVSTQQRFFGNLNSGGSSSQFEFIQGGDGIVRFSGSLPSGLAVVSPGATMVNDTWYHYALIRNGNDWILFKDGVAGSTASFSGTMGANTTTSIGRSGEYNAQLYTGYMDEIRISKGIARWTTNFTPEGSAYDITQRLLSGSVDISGQPSGTSMKYKIETLNDKDLKLHGASVLWA